MKFYLRVTYIILLMLLYIPMSFVYGALFLIGRGLWHPSRAHLNYISNLIDKLP